MHPRILLIAVLLLSLLVTQMAGVDSARAQASISVSQVDRSSTRGPRLRARYRLARRQVTCSRAVKALKRLDGQVRQACQRFMTTRAGRILKRASDRTVHTSRWVRGQMTLTADQMEGWLEPGLSRAFHRARAYNPLSFMGFAGNKFKQDPYFLTGYGVFSWGFSNLQTPLLLAMGVGAGAAVAIRFATGMPMDMGVILWREHSRRDDRSRSLWGTVKHLAGEYRDYTAKRREANRSFIRDQRREANRSFIRDQRREANHSFIRDQRRPSLLKQLGGDLAGRPHVASVRP